MDMKIWRFLYVVLITTPLYLYSQTDTKEKFSTSPTSVMTISVTIGGNFIVTGTFTALPNERIDQFITRMYSQGIARLTDLAKLPIDRRDYWNFDKYPLREILLKRVNGDEIKLDLAKYRLTGDFKYNPYLKNDDALIFPEYNMDKDIIVVEGAVNKPTSFQFVEGDKIEDALLFGRGINPNYEEVKEVEIYRLTYDGSLDTVIRMPIDLKYQLRRGDRLKIIGIESLKKNYRAFVDGEVKQPGVVYLPKEGLPIQKVLQQVGGLREDADMSRAELIRGASVFQSIYYGSEYDLMMMNRMAPIKEQDSLTFIIDNKLRVSRGAWASSLSGLEREQVSSDKVIIKEEDYLFIPRKIDYIYVFGQVNNFGFVKFIPNKDHNFYIEQAGGRGELATDEVYVIKNRTRAWILATEKKVDIEPGDFIWVPKEPIKDFDYYLQRIAFIGNIVTAIATTVLLFIQVTK